MRCYSYHLQQTVAVVYALPMRRVLRLFLFWLVLAPPAYYFGLPYALEALTRKTQTEAYDECYAKLVADATVGHANSPLSEPQAQSYCRCTSEKLVVTKADLWDAVEKKPPTALNALAQAEADRCGRELQRSLGFLPPEGAVEPAAPPVEEGLIRL